VRIWRQREVEQMSPSRQAPRASGKLADRESAGDESKTIA
jgi:hypothetical protein